MIRVKKIIKSMTFNRFNTGLFILMLSAGLIASELNEETQAHLREAEIALENLDYKMVIQKYLDATRSSNDLEITKQAAWLAEKYKFNKEALLLGLRWIEFDKKDNAALLFLINRQIDANLILAAKKNLKDLLLMHESSSDEVLLGVLPLLSDQNKDGLQKLIYYFTKIYNKSSYVRYAYASVLLKNGDITRATKEARIAIDLNPDWEKPKLLFARNLLLSGQNQKAINYIARIIGDQLNPSPEARLELALAYMSSEQLEDALGQVSQILLETRSNEALRLMAIINFRLGHYDSAWFDLNELYAKDLYRMDAMFYMARISEVRSNYNEALSYYSNVTSGVNTVYSQKRVVTLLVATNKIDEAKNHLREFGQKYPKYMSEMLLAEANLYQELGENQQALDLFDKLISYYPDNQFYFLRRASLLLDLEKISEALSSYSSLAKRFPKNATVLNAYGYTLTNYSKDYKKASRLIKRAIKLEPNNPAIIDSFGWVLYRMGKYENALDALLRAYELFKDPEIAAHIIEVLWKVDRNDEAKEFLSEAESLFSDSIYIENIRDNLLN